MLFSNLTALSSQVLETVVGLLCLPSTARIFHGAEAVRLRAGLFLLSRTRPASLLRSTEGIFPAESVNQAIVEPLPRVISFSLPAPPALEDFRSSLDEG